MKRYGIALATLSFLIMAVSFLAVAPASAAPASAAPAAAAGSYISLGLGIATYPDADIDVPGVGTLELSSEPGFILGAAVGKNFKPFRLEGELAYRTNDADKISGLVPPAISGEISSTSFLVNGYYDFATTGPASPFFGLGLGFANIDVQSVGFAEDDDLVLAYQLIVGVAIDLNPKLKLDVAYKYLGTTSASITADGLVNHLDYSSHALQALFRYSF